MTTIFGYITISWLYWTVVAIYIATILSIIVIIVSENRNPVKSLAWIAVLMLLPALGIVLYIFFGRSIKNKHMVSRRKRRRLRRQGLQALHVPLPRDLTPESRQEIRLARNISGAPYFPGNKIDIFTSGEDKFEALLADIAAARRYIHIQYYIIADDATGRRLADALIERARAGVKVRVIYDHIGSINTSNAFFRRMREAGAETHPFFRVVFPVFATRINWRNHRKICVIDGSVGYIGGMNIADRYITGTRRHEPWRDTHLRIAGPAVAALEYSFALDWSFVGRHVLDEEVTLRATPDAPGAGAQMLTSGPNSPWSDIALAYLKAIGLAHTRIYIQTPYFLPNEALLRALQAAALARVDVRLMLPEHSDSLILTAASFSYIAECLRAGVKIYLYQGTMLHAKTLIIDYQMASVGSTNFDFRSFEHNFESNIFVYSAEFNERMAAIFRADMRRSRRITLADWQRRPLLRRALESSARLLAPVL